MDPYDWADDGYELDEPSAYCFRIITSLFTDVILRKWTSAWANLDQLKAALKDAEHANSR